MSNTIIDANKKSNSLNLRELISYKDLLLTLAYRDFRVKYAQTVLGFVWAFIQPLTTLVIFTLVFGRAVKIDTQGIPYPLFALTGLVAWAYFSFVMSQSGMSIIGAQQMVKKIYFPRLVIPLSKALVGLVDFGISALFLIGLLFYYHYLPPKEIIWLPFFLFMIIISSLGMGIWLSALTIRYRDFQHIIPFMVQLGIYATPVAYSTALVPQEYQLIYHLNPMAGIIEGLRWSILGGPGLTSVSYISFISGALFFISSLFYFKQVERVMADIV